MNLPKSVLRRVVKHAIKPMLSPRVPVQVQRRFVDAFGYAAIGLSAGVSCETTTLAGVQARVFTPKAPEPGRAILWLHGGGFVIGSSASHRLAAAALASYTAQRVYVPDYRLAPEHPWPAAPEDACAAFKALSEQYESVACVGDSAGGCLALVVALTAAEVDAKPPSALGLISPLTDIGFTGPTMVTKAKADPMLSPAWLQWVAGLYMRDADVSDWRASPVFASAERLAALPPTAIHVGSEEVLLSDATRLAEQMAGETSSAAELTVWDGLWHDFTLHIGMLDEAERALRDIAGFINRHA